MRSTILSLSTVFYLFPSLVSAYTNNPQHCDCGEVIIKNYVQGSYNYLERGNQFVNGIYNREFDINPNGFTLQQLAATLSYQPKLGVGGLLNIIAGRDALTLAPFGYDAHIGHNEIGFVPLQYYLYYGLDNFNLMAGNFNSIIGYEAIEPTLNNHFSSSLMATFTQPNSHLGVRTTYDLLENDTVKLIIGANNGWDNIRDTSRTKTLEVGLNYVPNKTFSTSIQSLYGEERIQPHQAFGPSGKRLLVDWFAKYQVTHKFLLGVNYDYGQQNHALTINNLPETARWWGAAGYANYQLNHRWRFALRLENFDDKNGYRTGMSQQIKEATLTAGYTLAKNLELSLETRRDQATVHSYQNKNGLSTGQAQQSFAVAILYQLNNT